MPFLVFIIDRGVRKAHAKAKTFGGSKKVEGLKSNRKDRTTGTDREAQRVSTEDLSLFARLDELEEKETANAELDQLGKDNSDEENKTKTGFAKKEDGVRWVQPSTATDKDITKKKVKWEACVDKKDYNENDDDSGDEEEDDDVETTIPVKFTSSSMSLQGQVNGSFLERRYWEIPF